MFLTMVLAFLTGAGSFFITLEPAASEDSQLIDLWNDSFFYDESQEVMEVRVLSAEPSMVFSTCDGEMRIAEFCVEEVAAAEVVAAIENLDQEISKIGGSKAEGKTVEKAEEEEELLEEETYDEEQVYYEEPSYVEPSYDEPKWEEESSEVKEEVPSQSTVQEEVTQPVETQEEEKAKEPAEEPAAPAPQTPAVQYSDLDYLAAICQIEAGYNYEGCLAVANAVLNRLKAGYADSIYGVIYAPYQFATDAMDYYLQNGTGEDARRAAEDAMNGINNLGDFRNFNGTYWLDPATLDVPYVVIGGNCFY